MKALVAIIVLAFCTQASLGSSQVCNDGMAGAFPCSNVNMMSVLDLTQSGIPASEGNDVWGWTDPVTGQEIAIMGLNSKTAFVDVTDPANPVHLGDLATHTTASTWRDIKVYQDYAFIVSEARNHGMQIFDLTKLRAVTNPPEVFTMDAHYPHFGSSHNIVINEDSGYAYSVGTNTCDAGMHIVNIQNPLQPAFVTCIDKSIFEPVPLRNGVNDDEIKLMHGEDYTHDAQCVNYAGPDTRYLGREICVCSNADTLNIVDLTDKANPVQVSVIDYLQTGYTHQGWLTEDHGYFLLGDELDEMYRGHNTKTLIWDMSDLENPTHAGSYFAQTSSIDHNMYVKGNYLYQANYNAGLRVLDLSDVANGNLSEVAFFDTEPSSDTATFDGAWSIFPYFDSGLVVVSNIDGQFFTLQPSL